jgi:hypothetical protein
MYSVQAETGREPAQPVLMVSPCGEAVHLSSPGEDGGVEGLELTDGRVVEGDLYVSAMPGAAPSPLGPVSGVMQRPCRGPTDVYWLVCPTCFAFHVFMRKESYPWVTSGTLPCCMLRHHGLSASAQGADGEQATSVRIRLCTIVMHPCVTRHMPACSGRPEAADPGRVAGHPVLLQAGQAGRLARHQRPHLVRTGRMLCMWQPPASLHRRVTC